MENTHWLKQKPDKPLFPDLLWSQPQNRHAAGKLLIVGGSLHSIAVASEAYNAAMKAGIGTLKIIMPDTLEKTLGKMFPEAEFAPSTPSGSFSRQALAALIQGAEWADGVLLAGDFGRNSETAITLEGFAKKYSGRLTIAGDSVDYFISSHSPVAERKDTLLVADLSKVQKILAANPPATAIRHDTDLGKLVEELGFWTIRNGLGLLTYHEGQVIIALDGRVSTTPADVKRWQPHVAAFVSVWWLQHPNAPFEATTTAIFGACRK